MQTFRIVAEQAKVNQISGGCDSSDFALGQAGTIQTSQRRVARVAPTASVTGIVLQAGLEDGQEITVYNNAVTASGITFAASGSSFVASGVSEVMTGVTVKKFIWFNNLWNTASSNTGGI